MQIDIVYLKQVIEIFIRSEQHYVATAKFSDLKNEDNEKFLFHWNLLVDKELIENIRNDTAKFVNYGPNGHEMFYHKDIRLRDEGHTFYDALSDNTFIEKYKDKLQNKSVDFILDVAQKYMQNLLTSMV